MFNLVTTALAQDTGRLPFRIVPECHPTATDPVTEVVNGVTKTIYPCGVEHIIEMGVNVVNALIGLTFLAVVLFILIGGFRMILASGSPERIQAARANITTAIIGLVIVLVAWVLINTAIVVLTDCQGQWYIYESFKCS